MEGTIGNEATADAGSLCTTWCERVVADPGFAGDADALFTRESGAFDAVAASVLSRSAGADDVRAGGAAFAIGRALCTDRGDLPALRRLFDHLHDIVVGRLFGQTADDDGRLSAARAEEATRRARHAMEEAVVEATRGWFDESGRKLRHDVKTPLQASSLNLELLTLETAERGLDTEPLDTIQRSLDRVAELLARAEPVEH